MEGDKGESRPMDLAEELSLVVTATGENTEVIVSTLTTLDRDIQAFQREAQQQSSQYSDEALSRCAPHPPPPLQSSIRLQRFARDASARVEEVKGEWTACEESLKELRRFFGEDPRRCSVEDFFGTLKAFLDSYKRACNDIRRSPRKFHQLIYPPQAKVPDG
ncbi:hypothetical protein FOZ63_001717 [Perkinsus olseni]|uniref:FH2 domain-containing protein n=2 Tax=Perkinsus olseni TaxID=32597 RepID=A0A7J6SGP2_PEROL|nr:hypothetical protein FOZ63_001717 [Perkinsus olseni]